MEKFAFVFLCCAFICNAYQQYITFYIGTNFTRDSLTIRGKHVNTVYVQEFMANSQSFRGIGYWTAHSGTNYTGNSTTLFSRNTEGSDSNFTSPDRASIRHAGPVETSEQSISFYSDEFRYGVENIITTPAANNFAFVPVSLFSTGFSNWTFFTGADFDGQATCYISNAETHYLGQLNETLADINSIIRGCILPVDSYYYAS